MNPARRPDADARRLARILSFTAAALILLTVTASPLAAQEQPGPDPNSRLSAPPADDGDEAAERKVSEFPNAWYILEPTTKRRYPGWPKIEGEPPRPLRVDEWFGEAQTLEQHQGKVIVIYFWSAECGPCLVDLSETGKLAREIVDRGAVFFTIHDNTPGQNRLPAIIRQYKIKYPIGIDRFDITAREWEIAVRPMYVIIDAQGIVRALGLKSKRVLEVTDKLLLEQANAESPAPENSNQQQPQLIKSMKPAGDDEPADAAPAERTNQRSEEPVNDDAENDPAFRAEIPERWLEGNAEQRLRYADLMKQPPPPIALNEWLNVEAPLSLEELKGKVVLLDFWATWCGPCRSAVPATNALQEKYKKDGLVIIGVCHPRSVELMPSVVKQLDIRYPVCADKIGSVTAAYMVNSFPDYYLIDRSGALRIADCNNKFLEAAIEALLREPAPPKPANSSGPAAPQPR